MNILHVWNQAGVSSILAKYQNKLGHHVEVIKRDGYDRFGIDKFYGTTIFKGGRIGFYRYCRKRAREFDLVHVHSMVKATLFIDKPMIIHFHGSDLRLVGFWGKLENWLAKCLSKKMLVATLDLLDLQPNAEWLPIPIDRELFHAKRNKNNDHALFIKNWYEGKEEAEKTAESQGWKLTVLNPRINGFVSYKDMPQYLNRFEYFIDRFKIPSLSTTALQALSLGLKVVNWYGAVLEGFDERHDPLNVARSCLKFYEEAIK